MVMRFALAIALVGIIGPFAASRDIETHAVATALQEGSTGQQSHPGTQDMMKMHEQMMAEMKANRARLDALTKEMNNTSGSARVDAIAAVVTELVHQHDAMYDRMSQMHEHMMSGRTMMGR